MQSHRPGSLAAKLVEEAPTVVRGSSGRPGHVRIRHFDGNLGWRFSVEFHRDACPLSLLNTLTGARDPQGLLSEPSSD